MGQKQRKNSRKNRDILIPLLLVLVALPLTVRPVIYSCGYAGYDWYSTDDIIADFYCYVKSYFLEIIGIFSAIILGFRYILYRENFKSLRVWLPLTGYLGFAVLSTIFSVNRAASVQGNFESFESCPVLVVYGIMAIYAYECVDEERDCLILFRGLVLLAVLFVILGIFQAAGHDPFDFAWVQRLIMSEENYEQYAGEIGNVFSEGTVFLTLYNPNYAGIVLMMLFAVFSGMYLSEQEKRQKIVCGVLSAALLVLIWFTYSRTSLAVAVFLFLMEFWYFGSEPEPAAGANGWKRFLTVLLFGVLLCLLFLADIFGGLRYGKKLRADVRREPLSSMTTGEDGIHMTYAEIDYRIWTEDDRVFCRAEDGSLLSAAAGEELFLPMEADACVLLVDFGAAAALFPDANAEDVAEDGQVLFLTLAENTLIFTVGEEGYLFLSPSGHAVAMTEVEHADLGGFENFASARGYIWSRTLPLLPRRLLVGSGPDTFAEVFPQQDYAGKIVYSDRADMVIEKGHNDILTKWVQTGMLSVLCLLAFYVILIKTGLRGLKRARGEKSFMGRFVAVCFFACMGYLISGFFNDSTLQTAPFFWVFSGIVLAKMPQRVK